MKIAVAYYRVSTARQGKSGLGLAAQKTSVHLYARFNKIKLVKEFKEIESGRRKNRPFLQQALDYCRDNNATLIIAKLNRLGRNVAFVSALLENKIKIVAVQYPNASKLFLHIIAAFDQNELEEISLNTKAALKAAKRRGVKLGTYGKILAKKNKIASKKFATKILPLIKKIQRKGYRTIREIAEQLNQKKIFPFHGNGYKWHTSTVHHILKMTKI